MELNWTTFVLEIINFLVLVWLLKHFLYRPVKSVIAKRRQVIESQLHEAEEKQQQAEKLQAQYENRLQDWESEREEARQQLQREIEEERQRLMEELQQEIDSERERDQVLLKRQMQEQQRQSETQALELGARFVSRLLEAIASPEVQGRLFEHLLDELKHLPPAQRDALQSAVGKGEAVVVQVYSAYPLSEQQQGQLEKRIDGCVPRHLQYEFHTDRKLIAGLRVAVGPWVMHANLNDELKTFAAIAYER